MGMIGFTVTGVALYNALDAAGRDAAAHEVQDLCDGHPQGRGQYHYHSSSPCLPGAEGGRGDRLGARRLSDPRHGRWARWFAEQR